MTQPKALAFPSRAWLAARRRHWRSAAFRDARLALDAQCADHLAERVPVPDRRAGHYHDYFCPDHATQLAFDPDREDRHACPVDGRLLSGATFDIARLWLVNNRLTTAALRLSLRTALEPAAASGVRERSRVREILLGYVATYRRLRGQAGGLAEYPGVLGHSGLDESILLIRIAWAYGMVAAALPIDDRGAIESDLLEPMATHLRSIRCPPSWAEIDNIAVWNDAAQIVTAVVLGDEVRLERALDAPLGLRDQLSRGVRPDGLWWEGSLSYHFYTLAAVVWAVRAMKASGRQFVDVDTIHGMFRAPIALALPDLSLPAINDGWYDIGLRHRVGHDIPDALGFYETAAGWFEEDPDLAKVFRMVLVGRRRDSLDAILDGSDAIADEIPRELPDVGHTTGTAASGLAILRACVATDQSISAVDRQAVAILKAGPSGGSHGHPDQLALQWFAAGTRLLDDLGTSGYGIALSETWYRATGSHNTIVIDGRSQPLAEGRLSSWQDAEATIAEGIVTWGPGTYDGVTARRQIVLTAEYLIDLVEVTCAQPRTIDWVLLPRARLVGLPPSRAVRPTELGRDAGYAHVGGLRRLNGTPTRLNWRTQDGPCLAIELAAPGRRGREITFVGDAPSNPPTERIGFVVRRRTGTLARFAAVLIPSRLPSPPGRVVWTPDGSTPRRMVLDIETARGVDRWHVDDGRFRSGSP